MPSTIQRINRNLLNIPGWRTNRRILIIESDDWGSIRMASGYAYRKLLDKGYPVDQNPFNRFDALECNEDLETLFEVLDSVRDQNGNPALMTLNNVVGNPDFDKIVQSKFTEYFFEPFTTTLSRYPQHDRVMELYREGISAKLVYPQYHGREHVNISRWLNALQTGHKALSDAFELGMYSLHFENNATYYNEFLDALDIDSQRELSTQVEILKEGYKIFTGIWGYKSLSFIANCYIWHPAHEQALSELGVRYLQGIANQFIPKPETGFLYKRVFHYQGQRNAYNQRYLLRNVFFEPYQDQSFDWESECLSRIETAFRWNKPAIISTHRVNFAGYIDPVFRGRNLKTFKRLLKKVTTRWPDFEFMSSDQLGSLMDH